jgi:hypothetical protein
MRSPYDDPNDDEEDPGSVYAASRPPQGFDGAEAGGALPGQAADEDPYQNWLNVAPEAAGAAPFSTTPENASPRQTQPIAKDELQTIGDGPSEASQSGAKRSPKWDEIDRLDKKIEKQNNPGFWAGLGRGALAMQSPGAYGALVGGQGAALQKQRADLMQEAQYEDNRRGLQPVGKPTVVPDRYGGYNYMQANRLGQQTIIGPAPDPNANAKIRAQGLLAYGKARSTAMEKSYVDAKGQRWYVDPQTGEPTLYQTKGTPAQGNVMDADNPGSQSPYSPPTASTTPIFPAPGGAEAKGDEITKTETDAQGNVTGITRLGTLKKLGRIGQPKDQPVREDPSERRASMAGEAAMQAFLKDPTSDPGAKNPQEAYAHGYAAGGGTTKQLPGSFGVQHPKGEEKPFRNKATGATDTFVSDGKKWVKKSSSPAGLARSH